MLAPSTTLSPLTTSPYTHALLTLTLFTFLTLSRLGLWTFDLTTTQLTQTMNPMSILSSFTGIEYTFISIFELGQHVLGILWDKPEEFRWIASVGIGSVGLSVVLYAWWVRRERGHLVHWERLGWKKRGG
jgi:iron-regulated transporter 1